MNRKYVVLICSSFVLLTIGVASGFYLGWSATVSLNMTGPNIAVYWDSACTNPVTSIPLGNIQRGASKSVDLYIRNEGGGTINVYWNSTLSEQTDQITATWEYLVYSYYGSSSIPLNGTTLAEGSVLTTKYTVRTMPTVPLQSFSWILNVGAW